MDFLFVLSEPEASAKFFPSLTLQARTNARWILP
jgi:hypothetical protein